MVGFWVGCVLEAASRVSLGLVCVFRALLSRVSVCRAARKNCVVQSLPLRLLGWVIPGTDVVWWSCRAPRVSAEVGLAH